MRRKKPLYTAAGNAIWYSWYGSQYGAPPSLCPSCKQLKIDLEYDGLYHSLVYSQRALSTSETHTHIYFFTIHSSEEMEPSEAHQQVDGYRNVGHTHNRIFFNC